MSNHNKAERQGAATKLAIRYWELLDWQKTDRVIAGEMGITYPRLRSLKKEPEFRSAIDFLAGESLDEARVNARRLIRKSMAVQEKAMDKALSDDEYLREGLAAAKIVQDTVMPSTDQSARIIPQFVISIGPHADSRAIEQKPEVIDGESVEEVAEED